jgi:hypothetical protein
MSERDKVVDFSEDGKISVQNPLIRIDYAGANGGRGGKVGRGSKGGHGRGGGGGGSGGKKNRGEVRGDRLGDGGDEGIEPGREG